jgi:hypothetical protein
MLDPFVNNACTRDLGGESTTCLDTRRVAVGSAFAVKRLNAVHKIKKPMGARVP